MTVQQLLNAFNSPQEAMGHQGLLQPFNPGKKQFQVGQWVDVKDTVEQWLEAQVLSISENNRGQQVYVHYNGWPSHWDEWIETKSNRIAPFRTHTVQSTQCPFLSPSPTINLDG